MAVTTLKTRKHAHLLSTVRLPVSRSLLLLLVISFLSLQWSTNHIHLAAHHDHDGGYHQHDIQAHAHNPGEHHTDTIDADSVDVTHQDYSGGENLTVVELDHECSTHHCDNQPKHSPLAIDIVCSLPVLALHTHIDLPETSNTKHDINRRTSISPRAPPCLA